MKGDSTASIWLLTEVLSGGREFSMERSTDKK